MSISNNRAFWNKFWILNLLLAELIQKKVNISAWNIFENQFLIDVIKLMQSNLMCQMTAT
jgi:hypothetical protein